MEELKVKSLMSAHNTCMPPETRLAQVVAAMADRACSCMVIGADNHPQGIVTERDMVKVLIESQQQVGVLDRPVGDYMSSPLMTLNQDETLYEALVVARSESVRHLPVVNDDDCIVGMVTQTDLANAHFHIIEMQAELIEKSIKAKTYDLQRANDELQALSMEDHLLEIGNRRSMEVDLQHTHAAAVRYKREYSLVLLDVDFFKKYNDHYGHADGDAALKEVANYLKETIRTSDRVYRYGGEELLLLMPETPIGAALETSSRLVAGLAHLQIPHCESPFGVLTMSAGVSGSTPHGNVVETWEQVVEIADLGLYSAKAEGRCQAVCVEQSSPADAKVVALHS